MWEFAFMDIKLAFSLVGVRVKIPKYDISHLYRKEAYIV